MMLGMSSKQSTKICILFALFAIFEGRYKKSRWSDNKMEQAARFQQ